ncbi:MAG: NAD(P)-dependent glycerol-3-phosphate dehydrogenase [Chloroflexi bacterium]|nr:NAD(P)-dependent glycerol-3-phosphate dehydrogenase [Chloroflexota bacterium]
MVRVGVAGTTSWGTTLAVILARRGCPVALWARTEEEARSLQEARENRRRLPGISFPDCLQVTPHPEEALAEADLVILAVPSHSLRANARRVRESLRQGRVVLSAAKGLEKASGLRMTQVLQEELPPGLQQGIAVLSGPNLSGEIVQGKPATTVVASQDEDIARWVQGTLASPSFRVYTNTDVVGVELGGALKNIIAIGAGIGDGLGYGANAKAAFITRGLAEITRLGVAAGANPLTFAGLAGLGDLVATCFSPLSRNRSLGEQLGKGRPLGEILAGMDQVAEGVDTSAAALKLAARHQVEMPITEVTCRVLFHGLDPREAVAELMGRAPGPEWPPDLSLPGNRHA